MGLFVFSGFPKFYILLPCVQTQIVDLDQSFGTEKRQNHWSTSTSATVAASWFGMG